MNQTIDELLGLTPDLSKYDCNWSDFDIKKHKEKYYHYFEAIITSDGTVKYAHPSHQEKLVSELCHKYNLPREQAIAKCPQDMQFDYMRWLTNETGCIAVWEDYYYGKANTIQKRKLLQLRNEGMYRGSIQNEIDEKY